MDQLAAQADRSDCVGSLLLPQAAADQVCDNYLT